VGGTEPAFLLTGSACDERLRTVQRLSSPALDGIERELNISGNKLPSVANLEIAWSEKENSKMPEPLPPSTPAFVGSPPVFAGLDPKSWGAVAKNATLSTCYPDSVEVR
jgi:hypothetical protein